jgi:hypothetical protein
MVFYSGLFVCIDIAYNTFEHLILTGPNAARVSALVAFVAPRIAFGLICAALILHLQPDVAVWLRLKARES